jgi:hypothetical protein
VTPGTVLTSRLMVSEPRYRKSLRQFASAATSGLAEDELQQLVADMAAEGDSQPEVKVVPLLDMTVDSGDGRLVAAPPCRTLLRSLGTTAPAIQLLPQVLWQVALHLKTRGRLSFESEASLQRYSPLLFTFLQPHLTSAARPAHVIDFVDMLRQVNHIVRTCSAGTWLTR